AASRGPGAALPTLSGVERYVAPANLHAVAIEADAVTASGARFVREAVVVLTGTPLRPFRYAAWRQGEERAPAPQDCSCAQKESPAGLSRRRRKKVQRPSLR